MKTRRYLTVITIALACSVTAFSQNTVVSWQTLSGGFGTSAAANSEIVTDLGQSFVGRSAASNSMVESGFLVHPDLRGPVVAVGEDEQLPTVFALSQNFPNPFNPSTTIQFDLPVESHVKLTVYNTLGQQIVTLVDEERSAGRYRIEWNGRSYASGVYMYRLQAGPFVQTRKLMFLK